MFRPKLFTTFAWCRLRADNKRFSLSSESTISVLPPSPSVDNDCANSFVFGLSSPTLDHEDISLAHALRQSGAQCALPHLFGHVVGPVAGLWSMHVAAALPQRRT